MKKQEGDQIHAYYCVLAKDHEDAFTTVIKHSSEIDAWIRGNVKELGWKRIYGLSSNKLENANSLVTFNRDFPIKITNPIVDVPIASHAKTIVPITSQTREENKSIRGQSKKELVKKEEQVPDFGTEIPEGIAAADFHQNLFKPITTAGKRKKMTKSQVTKGQAVGISAMFQTKSPSQSSPTNEEAETAPASPKKRTETVVESALQMEFTSEDEPMPITMNEENDVEMVEPEKQFKEHPKGMSKYLVTESTGQNEMESGKPFGRRTKKSAPTLS